MDATLPDFENPPLAEVALSVQFEPLTALRTPQIGLLWREFRDRFPLIEEHPPLEPMIERFGVKGSPIGGIRVEMMQKPPLPRCWFLNESGTELVQVQQDRFSHNWRKVGQGDKYPRFKHVRGMFQKELDRFTAFVREEKLGELIPNQCEVAYVNHIGAGQVWKDHGDLARVIILFNAKHDGEFLPGLEKVSLSGSYVITDAEGQPQGRLHFSIQPVWDREDDRPMFLMNLVARGQPDGSGLEGVLRFMDIGREWIVRGFAAMTTSEMHKIWGRRDDR